MPFLNINNFHVHIFLFIPSGKSFAPHNTLVRNNSLLQENWVLEGYVMWSSQNFMNVTEQTIWIFAAMVIHGYGFGEWELCSAFWTIRNKCSLRVIYEGKLSHSIQAHWDNKNRRAVFRRLVWGWILVLGTLGYWHKHLDRWNRELEQDKTGHFYTILEIKLCSQFRQVLMI